MKKSYLVIPFLAFISFNAFAQSDVEIEDVTMNVVKDRNSHRAHNEIKSLVAEYMVNAGDITAEELEAMRDERKSVREELRGLRESGDQEALQTRLQELRDQRSERRAQFQEYLSENADLAEAIEQRKEEIRERRSERKDQRRERREQRRESNSDS